MNYSINCRLQVNDFPPGLALIEAGLTIEDNFGIDIVI
jgi:hypothetical protein